MVTILITPRRAGETLPHWLAGPRMCLVMADRYDIGPSREELRLTDGHCDMVGNVQRYLYPMLLI